MSAWVRPPGLDGLRETARRRVKVRATAPAVPQALLSPTPPVPPLPRRLGSPGREGDSAEEDTPHPPGRATGESFRDILAGQLEVLQEHVSTAHAAKLHDLEVENSSLREENGALRGKLQLPSRDQGSAKPGSGPHAPIESPSHHRAATPLPGTGALDEQEGPSWFMMAVPREQPPMPERGELLGESPAPKEDEMPEARRADRSTVLTVREPWPIWCHLSSGTLEAQSIVSNLSAWVSVRDSLLSAQIVAEARQPQGDRCVLHPSSNKLIFWTFISPFLLIYDTLMIPLHGCFDFNNNEFLRVMDIIVASYWALDVVRSCNTGYDDHAASFLEMRRRNIVRHYAKSWMLLDLSLVAADWILTFEASSEGDKAAAPARARRAARIWRVIRMARLLRVVKFSHKLWARLNRTLSLRQLLLLRSFYILVFDTVLCHYMACYFIALDSEGHTFIVDTGAYSGWRAFNAMQDLDNGGLYVLALNWAFSQSGFGNTHVKTTNTWERLYATLVGAIWLIDVAVTISFFTNWISEIRESRGELSQESFRLRKYIDENAVSRSLSHKIFRHFNEHYEIHAGRTLRSDVKFLRNLPIPEQISLFKEAYMPNLQQHYFLSLLSEESEMALFSICHLAVSEFRYNPLETVFVEGSEAQHMFCVLDGELDYYTKTNFMDAKHLKAGDWCCELALWTEWAHAGRLVSMTASELLGIEISKVHAVIEEAMKLGSKFPKITRMATNSITMFKDRSIDWTDLSTGPKAAVGNRSRSTLDRRNTFRTSIRAVLEP